VWIVSVGKNLTDAYHSDGAAVVEAVSAEEAIAKVDAIRSKDAMERGQMEEVTATEWDGAPQIFPNAGCC